MECSKMGPFEAVLTEIVVVKLLLDLFGTSLTKQ